MIYKVIGTALVTIILSLSLKKNMPEISALINLSGGLIISLLAINSAKDVIDNFFNFSTNLKVGSSIIVPALKVLGIGYLTEFCSSLASDTGNNFLSDKIILAGKIVILGFSISSIKNLLVMVLNLIQ
ncbi:MAG: hypothetical protein IJS68_01655 [Clostridia bacterium]|nr:hypothetical protein [Clostridia bacterium]